MNPRVEIAVVDDGITDVTVTFPTDDGELRLQMRVERERYGPWFTIMLPCASIEMEGHDRTPLRVRAYVEQTTGLDPRD